MLQKSEFSQRTEFVTITEFIKVPHRVLGIFNRSNFPLHISLIKHYLKK